MKVQLRPALVTPADRQQAAADYMRAYAHFLWEDMPKTAEHYRGLAEMYTDKVSKETKQ